MLLTTRTARLLGNFVRSHHMNPLTRLGARVSHWYLVYYWNEMNWDMATNGERMLLRALASHWTEDGPATVFDIGANVGEYSCLARKELPDCRIHCFEIVPRTREILANNLASFDNITVSSYGLSNQNTTLQIGFSAERDTDSRVWSQLSEDVTEILACPVITGDSYLSHHDVDKVDLLKIDTEGHEMWILEGFGQAVGDARIRIIQFEYGTTWIAPKRMLYEAYALLEPAGYRVGRLHPDGVFFKSYSRLKDENLRMGNYVAVHQDEKHLIDTLDLNRRRRDSRY